MARLWLWLALLWAAGWAKQPEGPASGGSKASRSKPPKVSARSRSSLPGSERLTAAKREREILELSWQLQRDSTIVRMRQHATSMLRRWWNAQHVPRVIVVSNRLPLSVKRGEDGSLEYSVGSGGMVSALMGVRDVRMVWVGWAGMDDATPEEKVQIRRAMFARGCVPIFLEKEEADLYYNGYCNGELWPLFHYVIANDVSPEASSARDKEAQWEAYKSVNAKFADAVQQIARKGDMVWTHDYHLMLLPSILRARLPQLKIGWFLHTPWPSSEVFRTLPMRRELLAGLLGADLLGFHIYEYARHFLHACTRLLGSEVSFGARQITWERQLPPESGGGISRQAVTVDAFPIGIDPARFAAALESRKVKARIQELQEQFAGMQMILGIDRVDYIKGIPQKLLAMETLLENHPELTGKIVLLQIAVPTRTHVAEYQKLRATAHQLVGRINGRFSSMGWVPIHYLDKSIDLDEMVALYYVATTCLVTSLRDGMNLVSYEFIACQVGPEKGVLVMSEFAGAAQALGAGCIRVNPYDIHDVARGIYEALSMGTGQRAELHAYASRYVSKYTAQAWAHSFLNSLARDSELAQARYADPLDLFDVVRKYANATRRLLVLGVGGTFLPATGATANDVMQLSATQCVLLRRLAADPLNTIVLVSARSRTHMDWLLEPIELHHSHAIHGTELRVDDETTAIIAAVTASVAAERGDDDVADEAREMESVYHAANESEKAEDVPLDRATPVPTGFEAVGEAALGKGNIWALAESGVFARRARGSGWEVNSQAAEEASWLEAVEEVFQYYAERTPGSRVERRDRTIRWAYGGAEAELGSQQASNLVDHLEKLLNNEAAEMIWEGPCVEVRPHGSSAGHGLLKLLAREGDAHGMRPYDFVLALGNFTSRDEDIFLQLDAAEMSESAAQVGVVYDAEVDEFFQEGREGGREVGVQASAALQGREDTEVLGELGTPEPAERMSPLHVRSGGVFSIVLGNRSTHAHFYLGERREAERLLHALALTPQSPQAVAAIDQQQYLEGRYHAEGGPRLPSALARKQLQSIQDRLAHCWTPAFFLDYDGTLSPIVADPSAARMLPGVGALLERLADRHPIAIVSGRSLEKLTGWVGVEGLYFAASHGFEMIGPHGSQLNYTVASELLPTLQEALKVLSHKLLEVEGVLMEDNKYALSVHTRNVSRENMPRVNQLVDVALEDQPLLKRTEGIHVIELRPQVHWHKGRAVEWLLKNMCEQMGLPSGVADRNATVMPIYIGDDVTDEDAFRALRGGRGLPIIVHEHAPLQNQTAAEMWLRNPEEVAEFLSLFLTQRQLVHLDQ